MKQVNFSIVLLESLPHHEKVIDIIFRVEYGMLVIVGRHNGVNVQRKRFRPTEVGRSLNEKFRDEMVYHLHPGAQFFYWIGS